MKRLSIIMMLVVSGCTSGGFVNYGTSFYLPKPKTHEIPVLETLPESGYVIIGTVWAEGSADFTELDQMLPELRKQARKAGGDALYQVKYSTEWVHSRIRVGDIHGSSRKPKAMAKVVVYTSRQKK